eukprot:1505917-Rhodomonas_salina.1
MLHRELLASDTKVQSLAKSHLGWKFDSFEATEFLQKDLKTFRELLGKQLDDDMVVEVVDAEKLGEDLTDHTAA